MPARQRKQPENRRRTGCFQCKEKHVQCTEEKPRCKRCERLGLECDRSIRLMFKEDAMQRGIHFGREGTWSKRNKRIKKPPAINLDQDFCGIPLDPYTGRWIFLNTTYGDFSGNYQSGNGDGDGDLEDHTALVASREAWMPDVSSSPSLDLDRCRPLGHPLRAYPETEQYLLNYFIQAIGPNCSLSARYNPYLSLVTPLCFDHPTLRNTLLAVSANQLRLLGDTRFVHEACLFWGSAIRGLQDSLNAYGTYGADYGTVASILMMCFHDISDGCAPSWTKHLRCGLRLTHDISDHSSEAAHLKRFFNMYFVAHDIMGRTAFEDKWEGEAAHGWLENDDLEEIDTTMGCSRGLMSLIYRISLLAHERTKILRTRSLTTTEIKTFITACEEIDRSLRTLNQRLPSYCTDTDADTADPATDRDKNYILQVAETKRLTAILYLMERMGSSLPSSTSTSSYSSYSSSSVYLSPSPSEATMKMMTVTPFLPPKQRLISTIISLISSLPQTSPTMLWPLFIVGTSTALDDEEHRRFVLDRLRAIQATRNLGSVRRARMAVERRFRLRDLDLAPSSHGSRGRVPGTPGGRGREWEEEGEGEGVISLA